MKKIAVILPSFDVGGTENMVANLAKYIDKDKFELLIISLSYPLNTHVQRIIEDSGVKISYAMKGNVRSWKVFYNVWKALYQFKPNLIHSNMYAFAFCVPYLLTHKIMLLHTIHNKPVNEFKNKYKRLISFLYKINKAVPVAISHIVEKEMKEVYKNSISTIERVYNPVEIKKFYTERKYKDSGSIIFINVARFMKQKNQELLIDAFAEVTKEFNNVKLFLVGDGELKQNIEYRIKKYNIDDKVVLVGNVSNVNYYLSNADIFVLSSDYEGLPLSILEAMASGLPIISTNVGGVGDIVTNNGILVSAKDKVGLVKAMKELASNHKLRYELGCNSLCNSQKYDSQEFIKQYENLYLKYACQENNR